MVNKEDWWDYSDLISLLIFNISLVFSSHETFRWLLLPNKSMINIFYGLNRGGIPLPTSLNNRYGGGGPSLIQRHFEPLDPRALSEFSLLFNLIHKNKIVGEGRRLATHMVSSIGQIPWAFICFVFTYHLSCYLFCWDSERATPQLPKPFWVVGWPSLTPKAPYNSDIMSQLESPFAIVLRGEFQNIDFFFLVEGEKD